MNRVNDLARSLPPTITSQFQGTAQAFESSLTGLGILLLIAILVIYLVLGILYESFIHPITILSGLPSAAFGALLTLQIFGYSLDLYGFVGVIMLIGIVKKNAIMMVDFAIAREREGNTTAAEAVYQGCLVRFRPIMMTTMAALMGTLPIALGFGSGADSRRPLGVAVCGGLIFSQLGDALSSRRCFTPTWIRSRAGWIAVSEGSRESQNPALPKDQAPRTDRSLAESFRRPISGSATFACTSGQRRVLSLRTIDRLIPILPSMPLDKPNAIPETRDFQTPVFR